MMRSPLPSSPTHVPGSRSKTLGVILDSPDEGWRSMDLVGHEILRALGEGPHPFRPQRLAFSLPTLARKLPGPGSERTRFNADRLLGRFLTYPAQVAWHRWGVDVFHLVDHSYAQLVHVLPKNCTGVHLQDLDTFRCLLPGGERRPAWFRAMARTILGGLQRARVIFVSTHAIREEVLRYGLVPEERLVHAPLGVAPEYLLDSPPLREAAASVRHLEGTPYLLHVGSAAPRKRLDVLFAVASKLRERFPELRLVQVGAQLVPEHQALVDRWALRHVLFQPPLLDRVSLASLYAHSQLTLVTSDYEGFGLPVVEALAAGARVMASDLPVLREVGADAAVYAQVGQIEPWVEACQAILDSPDSRADQERRRARGRHFSWERHVQILCDTYRTRLGL